MDLSEHLRLELGNVDDAAAHGGSGDEASRGVACQGLARESGALVLLTAPVLGRDLGAVVGAVEVGLDDITVVVERAVNHGALGPGNAGVGDKDVEATVEVLDGLVNSLFDGLGISHVDLVGFA